VKWDCSRVNEQSAEELPRAAVIPEAGNSDAYVTGGWRSERPWRDPDVCIQCLLCFIVCPDSSVIVENDKVVAFDYDHCKGCGICANECPVNPKFGKSSIEMVPEGCELPEVK